jgi:hypothetical protein
MSKWSANLQKETGRLAPKENDWNLPGSGGLTRTQTRFGGGRTSDVTGDEDDDDSSYSASTSSSEKEDVLQYTKKPEPTRLLIEFAGIKDLVEKYITCMSGVWQRSAGNSSDCDNSQQYWIEVFQQRLFIQRQWDTTRRSNAPRICR